MPFTGSHPAAVLPLVGTRLVASALVVGSMVPDLPYYLPTGAGPSAARTHSLAGTVGVDALLAALVWTGWIGFLARPALAAAPGSLARRVPAAAVRPLRERLRRPVDLLLLYASVVVGALTHVGWDAFTHRARWGTERVAWLHEQHAGQPGYEWAQLASGVVGGVVLAAAVVRWWRRTPPRAGDPAPAGRPSAVLAWSAVVGAAALGAVAGLLPAAEDGGVGLLHAGFLVATRGTAAAVLAAALLAAMWHLRVWWLQRAGAG